MNVAILLSTHNGSDFLLPLLDSLAAQSWRSWHLYVRDDGSTDDTLQVLDAFAVAHPGRVSIEAGENIGATPSFLRLLGRREVAAEMVAFCDQDDVWHRDKLERAVRHLGGRGSTPCLYCSRVDLVDANLRAIRRSYLVRGEGFENALFENVAIGCTIALNPPAAQLLSARLPSADAISVHDWWCYLAISAVGEVIYDPESTLDYRLHAQNAIGLPVTGLGRLVQQLRRFRRDRTVFLPIRRQASSLLELYGDLLPAERRDRVSELVAAHDRPLCRLGLALRGKVQRQRWIDAVVVRLLIALGLY